MEEIERQTHYKQVLKNYFLKSLSIGVALLVLIWILLLVYTPNAVSLYGLIELHQSHTIFLSLIDLFPLALAIYGLYAGNNSYKEVSSVREVLETQSTNVEKTAVFADKIGKGEYNYEFKPYGEEDVLGKALIDMRNSLLEANKKDVDNNWIVNGVAEVGDIIRSNNELVKLAETTIAFLTQKINAVQGAFYIVNYENDDDVFIELVGSYAYNRKKYLKGKFQFGQGLVGQSVIEKDTVHRTEIPDEYVSVTSGLLGDKKPKAILIVPLINEEKVYGAVELAGFDDFSPLHIKFIEELSDILARTIYNVKVNEETTRLLEEVNKSQQRTHVLLENASEVISIYDTKGNVTYTSPSVQSILGYDSEDIVGKNEEERVHPKGVDTVKKMFKDLNEYPDSPVTEKYSYIKPDGGRVWVESTGRNLIDNPYIKGILFNTIDITERKQAEAEQRERAKMQALSENSPDIIVRFDLSRVISYINPTIKQYTGVSSKEFLASHIDDLPLDKLIVDKWKEVLDTIVDKGSALITSMEFINGEGEKLFMEVNALPELGENGELESILMVLHDITKAKEAELEIQEANAKVQDSINYAKRIQNSILPKEVVLQELFKESFMMFRPRDGVSGDFPFVAQKGNFVYFAACDCTGHGVPGALLSLIGSLILNEVITYQDTPSAGVMLDHLHASVVKTLRQGQVGGENERDGMDVGMCRLDIKTGALQYAGAHRPLYIVRTDQKSDEDLEQLKGDKYPIGGVQYKGRGEFTNFETVLKNGDKIFVCSDGYPDQFGGFEELGFPEPKKIGPKRIRKLLVDHKDSSMEETYNTLTKYFDDWQGDEIQLDDVLFIGVQFIKPRKK